MPVSYMKFAICPCVFLSDFFTIVILTYSVAKITDYCPWHFLYFLPEPQGQGSLRPTSFSFFPPSSDGSVWLTTKVCFGAGSSFFIAAAFSVLIELTRDATCSLKAISISLNIFSPSFLYSTIGSCWRSEEHTSELQS